MEKIRIALLLVVGVINFLPLAGVMGADRLASLYGVSLADSNLTILMRHRAVLFGLIGAFIMLSAFKPALRSYAMAAGFISMLSFVVLALTSAGYNDQLRRIVMVDVVASLLLAIALVLHLTRRA